MKLLVSKDILPLAKLAKNTDRLGVAIFPDGRIVSTNLNSLIEVKRKNELSPEDFPIGENKLMDITEPVVLSAKQIFNKQKFEKNQSLPILEYGALLKGENGTVKIRTTDLDTCTEISYKPVDEKFPKYENLFPENPEISTTYGIDVISGALNRLKELGIEQVTFLTSVEKDKPLVIYSEEVRAMVMPFIEKSKIEDYKNTLKKLK